MRITTSKFHRVAITAVVLGVGLATTVAAPASAAGTYYFAGLRDWDRDGHQDIVARQDSDRRPVALPGREPARLLPRSR